MSARSSNCSSASSDSLRTRHPWTSTRTLPIYETKRDEVLEKAQEDGGISVASKLNCGFQYFEQNANLSYDSLPVLQKNFWISQAVYDSLIAYNNDPVLMPGYKFEEGKGDVSAKLPAKVSTLVYLKHLGMHSPPDLSRDDPNYIKTRDAMRSNYYYRFHRCELNIEAPAEAVSGIVRKILRHPLMFRLNSILVRELENQGEDRYGTPVCRVILELLVSDFDHEMFSEYLPEYASRKSPEAPENAGMTESPMEEAR
ncbi:MAG: hypothetical protein U5N86_03465 [Planctomycetota bacterium]|nr:hypothetical protein [Planctomycetota bacterium]